MTIKTDDLKKKFATGAIPQDTDFAALIDLADIGRQAVGLSDDLTKVDLGTNGLDYVRGGPLKLKNTVAKSGLTVDANGVSVKPGPGIALKDNKLLTVHATGALKFDSETDTAALMVYVGNGLAYDTTIKKDSSLMLNFKTDGGLGISDGALGVKLLADSGNKNISGLSLVEKGLALNVDTKYFNLQGGMLALNEQTAKDLVTGIANNEFDRAINDMSAEHGYAVDEKGLVPIFTFSAKTWGPKLEKKFQADLDKLKALKTFDEGKNLKGWAAAIHTAVNLAVDDAYHCYKDVKADGAVTLDTERQHGLGLRIYDIFKDALDGAVKEYPAVIKGTTKFNNTDDGWHRAILAQLTLAYNSGHKIGHDEGYKEGHEKGYQDGIDYQKKKNLTLDNLHGLLSAAFNLIQVTKNYESIRDNDETNYESCVNSWMKRAWGTAYEKGAKNVKQVSDRYSEGHKSGMQEYKDIVADRINTLWSAWVYNDGSKKITTNNRVKNTFNGYASPSKWYYHDSPINKNSGSYEIGIMMQIWNVIDHLDDKEGSSFKFNFNKMESLDGKTSDATIYVIAPHVYNFEK